MDDSRHKIEWRIAAHFKHELQPRGMSTYMTTSATHHHAGDLNFLKRLNRSAILETVRRTPGVTRADIASRTQLTKATVGAIVQELIGKAWLCEGALQRSGGGRPGRTLYLNDSHHVLLGADVGVRGLRLVACTLTGRIIQQQHSGVAPTTPEATAQLLASNLKDLIEAPEVRKRQCLGLGVAVPGPISPDRDLLQLAPNLGWRDVEFLELLAPLLPRLAGMRLLDNEAKAAAFGEFYFHRGVPLESLAYISAGTGIGSGLVTGGERTPIVLRGMHGLIGEIGHTVLQPDGAYCHCGNRGCAETLVSGWAIRAALGLPETASLSEALSPRLAEPAVQRKLQQAGEALGMLMLNLHHTLNPPEIVIGGSLTRLGATLMDPALAYFTAHQNSLLETSRDVRVRVLANSTFTAARGAAAQVLARAILEP